MGKIKTHSPTLSSLITFILIECFLFTTLPIPASPAGGPHSALLTPSAWADSSTMLRTPSATSTKDDALRQIQTDLGNTAARDGGSEEEVVTLKNGAVVPRKLLESVFGSLSYLTRAHPLAVVDALNKAKNPDYKFKFSNSEVFLKELDLLNPDVKNIILAAVQPQTTTSFFLNWPIKPESPPAARDGGRRTTITHDTDLIGSQHFRADQPVIRLFHNRAFLDSPFPAKGFVADRERFGNSFGTDESGVRDVLVLADNVKGDFFENVNDGLARPNVVGLLGSKIRIFQTDFSLVIPNDQSGTSQIVMALQQKFGETLRIELIGPRKWMDSMEGLLQEFGNVEVLKVIAASEAPLAEDAPTSIAHSFNDAETTQTLDQFLQGTRGFVVYQPTALEDAALRSAYFDYRITARGV